MTESNEISILQRTLELRQIACNEYTACDICPFNDGDGDDEIYKCKLEESAREIIETMFADND